MKIFAVRDEEDISNKNLAFLIYYENAKQFYIEMPDDADPWESPLLLESFVKRGEKTINAYWSKLWVQQRIVPSDRQNLGQVLKENGLEEYDEYDLLLLGNGRCAQDSYYLTPISESQLLEEFEARYQKKIEDIVPLDNNHLLAFFRNGEVKKCDMAVVIGKENRFRMILQNSKLFYNVKVQAGGYGISWGEGLEVADQMLYDNGVSVPLSAADFQQFVSNRVVSTSEAADLLDCSRQNIDDLVKRDKLHPIKITPQNKLFLKSEILQRKW